MITNEKNPCDISRIQASTKIRQQRGKSDHAIVYFQYTLGSAPEQRLSMQDLVKSKTRKEVNPGLRRMT